MPDEVRRRSSRRRFARLGLVGGAVVAVVLAVVLLLTIGQTRPQEVRASSGTATVQPPSTAPTRTSLTAPPSTSPTTSPTTTPVTTSTTTTPATTSPTTTASTTSPSRVPAAPSCNPQIVGSGVKPSGIFFGCATSADNLNHISWSSWDTSSATGTATHSINNCTPTCVQGTFTSFPVDVTLSNPGIMNGAYLFRNISTVPTTNSGAPESATDQPCASKCPTYGVNWGYIPS